MISSLTQDIELALSLHRKGLLNQALHSYTRIVSAHPESAECHHLIGLVAFQKSEHLTAIASIRRAIALAPKVSAFHCNLGNVLSAMQAWQLAVDSYSDAIEINPHDVESWTRKGDALLMLGELENSIASYDKAILLLPQGAMAHCNRAVALEKLQQLDAAIDGFNNAIDLNPNYAEAHCNKGLTLILLEQYGAAIESLNQAIAINPTMAQAFSNRGNALKQLKQWQAAVASFDTAIKIQPDYSEAFSNRGIALQEWGRIDAAIVSFNQAIALNPLYAQAYCNRSVAEMADQNFSAALESCNHAIALEPTLADAFCNRGNAQRELKQLKDAIDSYCYAITLKPDFAAAYCNQGVVYKELQNLDAAIGCFDMALQLDPHYVDAAWNKALTLLLGGHFDTAWKLHEWRWHLNRFSSPLRCFKEPLWLGDVPLQNKTLLLHSEQGLGDTIQFCRYAQMAAGLGATVLLEVQRPLAPLLLQVMGADAVFIMGQPLPSFDLHCPLMSLPLAFSTRLDTIPCSSGYLRSEPKKLTEWDERIKKSPRKKIGIVWRGSCQHKNDRNRSIDPELLLAHLPVNYDYICLQNELTEKDAQTLQRFTKVRHFANDITDFTDTAALCDLMDVVVSVDTSVAHLSAALGKPTCLLLPYAPDWRWLLGRDDSPWYDSMRLYRQNNDWDWMPVLQNLHKDLINGVYL